MTLRARGFRQAVVEAYNYKCAVCGLRLRSPDSLSWEVEAAHIVPHGFFGKDDIWNGLALCRFHHWAFDVGWFTLQDDFMLLISPQAHSLPSGFGKTGSYDIIRALSNKTTRIHLPSKIGSHPHHNAIRWHRKNIFCNPSHLKVNITNEETGG